MKAMMKQVKCPDATCGHEHMVQASSPKPMAQTGVQTYNWPKMNCEKCKKPFEYDGDPKQTRSRHVAA